MTPSLVRPKTNTKTKAKTKTKTKTKNKTKNKTKTKTKNKTKTNAWLGVNTMFADAVWWPRVATKCMRAATATMMPKRMKWIGTL